MEKCRCKVALSRVEKAIYQGKPADSVHLVFNVQQDETLLEDQRFAVATPSAYFRLYVDNPTAAEFLQGGNGTFYVDFTPVEDESGPEVTDDDGETD